MTAASSDPDPPDLPVNRVAPADDKRAAARPAQCRAARAWIGWTQEELAYQAAVSRKTVVDFEHGTRTIRYRSRKTITTALESAGAEFLWADNRAGDGVTFRKTPPLVRSNAVQSGARGR